MDAEKTASQTAEVVTIEAAKPSGPILLESIFNKDRLTAKVEYKDGIIFDLNFVSRALFQKLTKESTVKKYDPETRNRVAQVDTDKLFVAFCAHAVTGWSGMTVRKAANIVPLKTTGLTAAQLDQEVPFSQEQLVFLIKNSAELESFLNENATQLSVFNDSQDDEVKN